ncbi:MAG: hypothetical protein A4E52_01565 [Pelotomaculum sp. PtaB.Bin013]|nr:MAG: hypothetical protein A4E52_01565 [Pelotomaculum sp. PtaB.Bin013]
MFIPRKINPTFDFIKLIVICLTIIPDFMVTHYIQP